jgi:hypothetical protein
MQGHIFFASRAKMNAQIDSHNFPHVPTKPKTDVHTPSQGTSTTQIQSLGPSIVCP